MTDPDLTHGNDKVRSSPSTAGAASSLSRRLVADSAHCYTSPTCLRVQVAGQVRHWLRTGVKFDPTSKRSVLSPTPVAQNDYVPPSPLHGTGCVRTVSASLVVEADFAIALASLFPPHCFVDVPAAPPLAFSFPQQ